MDIERNPYLAPLLFFRLPIHKQILYILAGIFILLLMISAPSGWLYDLGLKTGTEQGQRPDQSVQIIHTQNEVEDFYFKNIPATVLKNNLIQCPLGRLRDPRYAGKHTNSRKITHEISEYTFFTYPLKYTDKIIHWLVDAFYNSYYLALLEDGTYVCVYFDDYLMLSSGEELHTGYVRYATTPEKKMLHTMAKDYEVNPMYVLDMYRHGKVSWVLDSMIRFILVILIIMVISSFFKSQKKEEKNQHQKETRITNKEEKFTLRKNEIIVGCAQIYNRHIGMNGRICVTNQRVCFVGNITGDMYMNLSISEIEGYDTWRILLTPSIEIYDKYSQRNIRYQYTGLAVKKLQGWLEEVGIKEI